jgi:hypothetical protein
MAVSPRRIRAACLANIRGVREAIVTFVQNDLPNDLSASFASQQRDDSAGIENVMSAKISATGAAVFEINFRLLTKQEIIDAGGNVRKLAVGVEPPAQWTGGIGRQRRYDALFLTLR